MKPSVPLVLIGVLCVLAGLGFSVYCYAQFHMMIGAVAIALIAAGVGSSIVESALRPKSCPSCGEPAGRRKKPRNGQETGGQT